MTPEFDLIARHFTRPVRRARLGVGDDCALLSVAPGFELAVSTDTLVAGTHFFPDVDPGSLGHKALAVNLSDLAAMGAIPRAVLLALTLPAVDDAWLAAFANGFFQLAERYDVDLIGGDTTRGPLSMTLTVLGEVEAGRALTRAGARSGDDIWVSGCLGGAALALRHLLGTATLASVDFQSVEAALLRPEPRVALGRMLLEHANAAIDLSDGLMADIGHIAERSGLAARIEWSAIPLHVALRSFGRRTQTELALAGGDDYELAFTAPPSARSALAGMPAGMALTRIGEMVEAGDDGRRVAVIDAAGNPIDLEFSGFDHFARDAS